jgi:hypothetical protein
VDGGAFVAGLALVAAAVALASYGPRRATKLDPAVVLKSDA